MTPQMMRLLHHRIQTSFLPELLRTHLQCCFLIFAAPCNIPYTVLLVCYNVYMGLPQYSILPLSKATFSYVSFIEA